LPWENQVRISNLGVDCEDSINGGAKALGDEKEGVPWYHGIGKCTGGTDLLWLYFLGRVQITLGDIPVGFWIGSIPEYWVRVIDTGCHSFPFLPRS